MSLQKNYIGNLAPDSGVAPIASAVVIAENDQRAYLIILNNSDEAVALGLGGSPAELNKGVIINPLGSYEMLSGQNLDGEAVEMICVSGGKAVSWQEADLVSS